jgi:surfactin synthase thioesterase subunit
MSTREDGARWLKRYRRGGTADVQLFCFHHAGGTAALFRDWANLMPPEVEPIAVQLPGRSERFRETPFDTMSPLIDALIDVMVPHLERPYAFYGLSMGGKVAWTLTHRLRDRALPMPAALFLSNVAAPGWIEGRPDWDLSDDVLVHYLREMGGTPPEILAEPKLLAFMLPTLRADLTLVDSFTFRPAGPLDLPIHAFAGADDVEGGPERMAAWRTETSGSFELDVVSGGHFFDAPGQQQVIGTVGSELLRVSAP